MRRQIVQLTALLTGAALLLVGNGLVGVLVPLRATLEDFPGLVIGLLSSAFSAGFLVGCLLTPHLLARVGHVRTFSVLAALASTCLLLLPLSVTPAAWLAVRVGLGVCNAGLLMTIESWINERCEPAQRGQLFAFYMLLNLLSVTLGQLALALTDPAGHVPFLLAAILVTLSLVPVGLTRTQNPAQLEVVKLKLGRLWATSPVAVAGCFVAGLASGAFGGLGVVYAVELGLSVGSVAVFMSAAVVGGAVLQLPVGRLSDRMDRRVVLIGCCVASAAMGVLLALLPAWAGPAPAALPLIAGSLAYGAAVFTIYGVSIAHANDRAEPHEFVEVSGGLLLIWALGAMAGPVAASLLMEAAGLGGVFWTTAAAHLLLGLFTLLRLRRAASVPEEEKMSYEVEPVASRPTPVTVLLHPNADEALAKAGEAEGGGEASKPDEPS